MEKLLASLVTVFRVYKLIRNYRFASQILQMTCRNSRFPGMSSTVCELAMHGTTELFCESMESPTLKNAVIRNSKNLVAARMTCSEKYVDMFPA